MSSRSPRRRCRFTDVAAMRWCLPQAPVDRSMSQHEAGGACVLGSGIGFSPGRRALVLLRRKAKRGERAALGLFGAIDHPGTAVVRGLLMKMNLPSLTATFLAVTSMLTGCAQHEGPAPGASENQSTANDGFNPSYSQGSAVTTAALTNKFVGKFKVTVYSAGIAMANKSQIDFSSKEPDHLTDVVISTKDDDASKGTVSFSLYRQDDAKRFADRTSSYQPRCSLSFNTVITTHNGTQVAAQLVATGKCVVGDLLFDNVFLTGHASKEGENVSWAFHLTGTSGANAAVKVTSEFTANSP